MTRLREALRDYGAPGGDCVDLRDRADPRLLRYADLIRDADHPLVDGVVEQQNQALLYVIDHARLSGRHAASVGDLRRALAMRGDPSWLGVLRPGQLDIYATDLRPDPDAAPKPYPVASGAAHAVLPRLAQGEDLAPPSSLMLRAVLLNLMTHAGEELKGYGLSSDETIALTGRALFFRYLIGRKIVVDGHLPTIAPSAPALKECFSTAANLAETNHWLDVTFNGDLLTLPDQDYPAYFARLIQTHGDKVTRPLRAIMGLDISIAPGISQRTLDWVDLDFNHLPIGLLSETYEALIEHLDKDARRDTSVYYTPAHIAEYMVEEALHKHPAGAEARVLDPACGAGVFLVACFRKLAELRFKATGERPTREALRAILDQQLTGFDTNAHARTLAALALYLTALELDPEPTPVEALKFDKLEGRVLIDVADPGSGPAVIVPMAGSLGEHVAETYRGAFDLVIGNPPWTSLPSKYAAIDRQFTQRCRAIAERRGLADIARGYKNPDKVPDLPFVWGAMEWAKPDNGRIALALAGRWLFKMTEAGYAARRAIFRALAVTGILNGASLRQTAVWPNTDQPFCLLFADNRVPGADDDFVLVSPEWEPELNGRGRMRIDALDAVPVNLGLAAEQRSIIKTLYRGTALDMAVVERVHQRTNQTIGDYWKPKRGLYFSQGYQVASRAQDDSFLENKPTLGPGYSKHPFLVLDGLPPYQPKGLHRPRDPRIYNAPLILVREGSRAERSHGRALICFDDVAYNRSFYGFSSAGHNDATFLAQYLLALLHSQVFEHFVLMTSGRFGVEREVIQVLDVVNFPFVDPNLLSREVRHAVEDSASGLIANQPDWVLLDEVVAKIYGLSNLDQQTIADTLATRAPFAAAKSHAGQAVTTREAEAFRARLEAELGNVLAAGGHRVAVGLLGSTDRSLPWRFLGISLNGRPIPLDLPARWLDAADDLAASRITLIDASEPCLAVGLLNRYRYWTPTQARLVASDLLWQHGALLEERAQR